MLNIDDCGAARHCEARFNIKSPKAQEFGIITIKLSWDLCIFIMKHPYWWCLILCMMEIWCEYDYFQHRAFAFCTRNVKLAGYSILDIGHSHVQCPISNIRLTSRSFENWIFRKCHPEHSLRPLSYNVNNCHTLLYVVLIWFVYQYHAGLLHWLWRNIASPVPAV